MGVPGATGGEAVKRVLLLLCEGVEIFEAGALFDVLAGRRIRQRARGGVPLACGATSSAVSASE